MKANTIESDVWFHPWLKNKIRKNRNKITTITGKIQWRIK